MKKSLNNVLGYSRLEIAFICVLVALIGTLAVTKYLETSESAKGAMEPGLIEGVRKGISEYAEESRYRGNTDLFPAVLDDADLGDAGQRNLFFDRVLEKGVAVAGWAKIGRNAYRTPSGRTIVYHPASGAFDFSSAGNGARETTPAPPASGSRE